MITVHADRCSGCGLCVKNCHEDCLALVGAAVDAYRYYRTGKDDEQVEVKS